MRSLIIITFSLLFAFNMHAQDAKEKGQAKEAAQKYFQENINPFITKRHNDFLTQLSLEDRALLSALKAKQAEFESNKKDRKERPKNEDMPSDISREEFHKVMKEKHAGQSEARETFKMDMKYLSHKYQDALEEHMEAIKAEKEVWKKDMKDMRPERQIEKPMNEKVKQNKAKAKKGKAKRGGNGFLPKFLLWDTDAAAEKNMRELRMGRRDR